MLTLFIANLSVKDLTKQSITIGGLDRHRIINYCHGPILPIGQARSVNLNRVYGYE
jgi:hypothetical protein